MQFSKSHSGVVMVTKSLLVFQNSLKCLLSLEPKVVDFGIAAMKLLLTQVENVFSPLFMIEITRKNSLIKATRKRTLESPLCLHSLPNLNTTCWPFTFLPPPSVIFSNFYNIVPSASSSCLLNQNQHFFLPQS